MICVTLCVCMCVYVCVCVCVYISIYIYIYIYIYQLLLLTHSVPRISADGRCFSINFPVTCKLTWRYSLNGWLKVSQDMPGQVSL
jgi:hypothetical protein